MTTQPHPEPSEEATFPPFPQNAIMSADAWRWSTERDSIWLNRVGVGQSQLNAMRAERDKWYQEAAAQAASAIAAHDELAAIKAAPVVDVEAIMRLAEKMMRDSWATGDDSAWHPARDELRAALASPEGSPR